MKTEKDWQEQAKRLLKGELASVRGDPNKASQHYRAGILHAESEGRLCVAALGMERLAIVLAERGQKDRAAKLLDDAGAIYEKWGAHAKAYKLSRFQKQMHLQGKVDSSDGLASTQSASLQSL